MALALLASGRASANGRYPYAQQLVEQPGNPARLWLRTTYGILTSADAGKSWHWICEGAVDYTGLEDPAIGAFGDGTVMAGVFKGLAESRDSGCSWSFVDAGTDAGLASRYVADVTVDPNVPSRALVLLSTGQATGTYENQIWQTGDNGKSFTQLGSDLDPHAILLTLDTAPSNAQRIYVSAVFDDDGGGQGGLLRSDDGGKTWQRVDIPASTSQNPPYIAAIDPVDPGRIFVRLNGDGVDQLVYSADAGADAGATWKVLIEKQGELFGFALSPDGKTVLAGFGRPDQNAPYDQQALGIWSADTTQQKFSRIFGGPVSCLRWTASGVYACASQLDQGFELGLSQDQGKTFSTLLSLDGVLGPLECPATSNVGKLCGATWPIVCAKIGRCGLDAGGGGAPDAGGLPDAGGGTGGAASAKNADSSSGCGCRLAGHAGEGMGALLALLALCGLWAGRRRRR